MRRARATLIAILLVGMAMTATAGDMALTRNGEFYRVAPSDDGLVVSHRLTDGTVTEYLIPQTSGITATSMQVGVDELTGVVFVAWQNGEDLEATIEIAWLADDWWIGPYTMAGGDGTAVENPADHARSGRQRRRRRRPDPSRSPAPSSTWCGGAISKPATTVRPISRRFPSMRTATCRSTPSSPSPSAISCHTASAAKASQMRPGSPTRSSLSTLSRAHRTSSPPISPTASSRSSDRLRRHRGVRGRHQTAAPHRPARPILHDRGQPRDHPLLRQGRGRPRSRCGDVLGCRRCRCLCPARRKRRPAGTDAALMAKD